MSLEKARKALAAHPDIKLAIVFGSVARDQARRDSDIDIAVQADRPLSAERRVELVEDLALATGRPVDLVDLTTVGVPLLGEIIRHGRRIFGNADDYAEAALRNIYLNEDFLPYVKRTLEERNRRWLP